jgi:hypothetical protein
MVIVSEIMEDKRILKKIDNEMKIEQLRFLFINYNILVLLRLTKRKKMIKEVITV